MTKWVWVSILCCSILPGGWTQEAKQSSGHIDPAVGPGVVDAHLVLGVPASVPENLTKLRRVTALLVVVDSEGVPVTATVVNRKSNPLDDSAINAVLKSKFDPGNLHGKPIETECLVWVPFMGDGEPAVPLPGDLKLSKAFSPPVAVFTPQAEYSQAARIAKIQGVVLLRVIVDDKGWVTKPQLLRSIGYGLDEEALKAVSHYEFRPAKLNGIPVPFLMSILVNFRLPER